ncbi:DUF1996 domain-containing protein [Streptomyces althioticus]|uniref:DUF1996 domain-containing protein n=1 Tax=Streptomyces althioticus TaxID=83380 RepID=A0ABZ1YA92_9ACTN|nr:DUF1996 domain-containing protein [Streptomyces althioticus]GGQ63069.1 hypothetical protein GCM10010267_27690 [Streptomyces griseorubens]
MGRNTRKRRTPLATKVIAGAAALAIGGGGLVWANFYASAHEKNGGHNATKSGQARVATINCPDVGQKLTKVPRKARWGVARELARLDRQITEAYSRLAETRQAQAGDAGYVDNAILGPLKDKRRATLDRININIKRAGGQERDLGRFARCQGVPAEQPGGGDGGQGDGQDGGGQNDGGGQDGGQNGGGQDNGGQAGNGPVADDFIRIEDVQPGTRNLPNGLPANGDTGSTGSFTTVCGTNENALRNSDNVIVAPGVSNGAQHQHDYVGNQANTAFASDEDLAGGDTSCQNQGDRSSYFWPVLRIQDGTQDIDQDQPGGGQDGNVGKIVAPTEVNLKFVGNRTSEVVAMPRALRIITGDAKAFTNGLGNANTAWSCTGFEDRQVTDKYPICPEGSGVVRTSSFQSCWDGQNTDSANHRTHVAFVGEDGSCPNGFQAIPQLQVRLVYDNIPAPQADNGQLVNPYAVDTFPEQLHKPITDHNDFINFFDENLMNEMVQCINSGQDCQ